MEFCQTSTTELLCESMWIVLDDWANGGMLMVFFRCGALVLVYVLWEVGPILRNGYGI